MAFLRQGSIALGPGGLLANVPENQEVLRHLQESPELSSEELLRLAEYFKAYPTNAALGNHLALVALTKLERHRGANGDRGLHKIVFAEHLATANDLKEVTEAIGDVFATGEGIDNQGRQGIDDFRLFIRHLSDEGLLVETLSGTSNGKEVSYHLIIGVSPAPDDLKHE